MKNENGGRAVMSGARRGGLSALVGALAFMCAPGALAGASPGEFGNLSEADFFAELPVVLSATRLRQPLSDTPAAITVIDRQMIRDSGAWDVADLFRLVPGMYVAYNVDREVVPGHVVSYHGLADPYAKRMQILVDGRTVYTPLFGGPVWSNIPLALDDIERVEVVRGPNAASYGANSFLGVINIITRDPAETHGNRLSLASGTPGSDLVWRHGGGTENSDYRLTLQWRDDRGYTRNPVPIGDGRSVYPRHDDKEIHNLALRSSHRFNARDELQFHFGYSGGTREAGSLANSLMPFHEKDVHSQFAMLQWQRDLAPDNQLSLRFFHNRDTFRQDLRGLVGSTDFGPLTLAPPMPLNGPLSHVAERYDLELQHVLAPTAATRLVWGAGLRQDGVRSRLYFNSSNFRRFRQENLFANLEWRPHADWLLNLGTMVEHNDSTGTRASPRLGVNFRVADGHTLRAIVSRAFRNPVIFEQQADSLWRFSVIAPAAAAGLPVPFQYALGRENLAPERIDSREIGWLVELGSGGSLDLKFSRDHLRRLVEMYEFRCAAATMALPQCAASTPGTEVRLLDNLGEVRVDAWEAQWQQRLWQRTQLHFGWASTRIHDRKSSLRDGYERMAPRHSWNLLLAHQFADDWRASLGGYWMKPVAMAGGSDALPSWRRWDLRVAHNFRLGNLPAEVAVIVQNLHDSGDREFSRDNVSSRRLWTSLKLDF
ncbi:MAG: TonB-dependent receptor [Azospira sp.]|nr:TonB-dependent receptor [Azospira sp.]